MEIVSSVRLHFYQVLTDRIAELEKILSTTEETAKDYEARAKKARNQFVKMLLDMSAGFAKEDLQLRAKSEPALIQELETLKQELEQLKILWKIYL